MIKTVYCIILLISSYNAYTQKSIDFIISIDESVVSGSLSGIKIISVSENGAREVINVDYHPGSLSLIEADYKKLLDSSVKKIFLALNYIEYSNNKVKTYNYEIDLKKGWLNNLYFILYIYNTTKSRYKRLFNDKRGIGYVYEFEYPGGGTKLIRNSN